MHRPLWLVRAVCLLYLTALTILLLVPDPWALLFGLAPNLSPPNRGVHLSAFVILALLCAASRPPWPATRLSATLIVYAIVVESLQAFVEGRVVELPDYVENLSGLVLGAIIWHLACRLVRGRRRRQGSEVTSNGRESQ